MESLVREKQGEVNFSESGLKTKLLLIAAAAVLTILSHEPFNLWPLAWVSLVPFLLALHEAAPRAGFRLGMLFGIVVYGVLLHWFVIVFGLFGVLLPLVPAVFIGLFGLLYCTTQKVVPKYSILLAPVFWTGLELFRCELWHLRFAWLTPACSQHSVPLIIQSADLFGCYWITFLIVAFNTFIAGLIVKPEKRVKLTLISGILAIAVFIPVYGILSIPVKYGGLRPVALVQSENGYMKCLSLSRDYIDSGGRARLLVWPEYSTKTDLSRESVVKTSITGFSRENGVELILGAVENIVGNEFYNAAFYINAKGEVAGRFIKAYPVQFFNDGVPGKDRMPVNGKYGVLICYDLGYPEVARNLVTNGAQVLIAPTMDAYSWGSWQHEQHAAVTALRAVETRRWVLRAASSGICQIVSSCGGVRESLGYGKEGVLAGGFCGNTRLTLYVRLGYLFSWLCLAVSAIFAALSAVKLTLVRKKAKNP